MKNISALLKDNSPALVTFQLYK